MAVKLFSPISKIEKPLRLDEFFIVSKKGDLLAQQTEPIQKLFYSLRIGHLNSAAEEQQLSRWSWFSISCNVCSEQEWILDRDESEAIAVWRLGSKCLKLFGHDLLEARYEEEGIVKTVKRENTYIQWKEDVKQLTPFLNYKDGDYYLYLIEKTDHCREKFFCVRYEEEAEPPEQISEIIASLKKYLRLFYAEGTLPHQEALRLEECQHAVCRIVVQGHPKGTGFVIGNRLIMTANHVLENEGVCTSEGTYVEFFYDDSLSHNLVRMKLDPVSFFAASPFNSNIDKAHLDFTIVALEDKSPDQLRPVFERPIPLNKLGIAEKKAPVYLIHHSKGKSGVTSLAGKAQNHILDKASYLIYHGCPTDDGSSGAPLLSHNLEILGVHNHCSTPKAPEGTKAAVRIDAIIKHLRHTISSRKPEIHLLAEIEEYFRPLEKSSEYVGDPVPRSPKDFTGRKDELSQLHTACLSNPRVALIGLGGIGKTTLALKYADEHGTDYQFIHFMPSGSSALVIQGLLQLADGLKIPKTEKAEERLKMLKIKLDRLDKKYLLIFDGVDQMEAFQEVEQYLPLRGQCILLTSRMPEETRIRNFERIILESFSIEDGIEYLLKVTGSKEQEKAKELAEKLGRLPLALSHAAGYICKRGITIEKYIEQFNKYDMRLFEDRYLSLTKEEKTILKTWQISMDSIEKVHNCLLAKKILSFFAFLGQASIPLSLLEAWVKQFYYEIPELDFQEALARLCDYSMIDIPYPNAYSVHLLVQSVSRYQLSPENRQKFFEQALDSLVFQMDTFDLDKTENWPLAGVLIPHAEKIVKNVEKVQISEKTNKPLIKLLDSLSQNYRLNARYEEAIITAKNSLEITEALYKKESIFFGSGHNDVGLSLGALGKHAEALEYQQKAIAICRKVFGERHPTTATSYDNVGLSLEALGRHPEALEFRQKALAIRLKAFGEEHPTTATSYNNVGLSLEALGRRAEALESQQKSLAIKLKTFGKEHPTTAISYNNVGLSLMALGRHAEALEYQQKALAIRLKAFGEEHPLTATIYNSIGMSLGSLGRHAEALKSLQKALAIRLKAFGEEHSDTAASYDNVAFFLLKLGRGQEALEYMQKAFEIRLTFLGPDHPDIKAGRENLREMRDTCILEVGYLYKESEIKFRVFGQDHPEFIQSLCSMLLLLSKVLKAQGTRGKPS